MHTILDDVKKMPIAEIRETLRQYIEDVQPKLYTELLTDRLLTAIETKSADISQAMKIFMAAELNIANQTGDYHIHDMVQKLRQYDRFASKKNKVQT